MPFRPRSLPCTPRRRAGRTPTGPRSSASMTSCSGCGPRPWSSSIAPSRSGCVTGPGAGLDALSPLLADPALATYGYLSAARADFLSRLENWPQAMAAYEEALTHTDNETERAFLTERLTEVARNLRQP